MKQVFKITTLIFFFLHCMNLKLIMYFRNVFSFFYKPKSRRKFWYMNIFSETFIFVYFGVCFTMFTENRPFWGSTLLYDVIWRHTLGVCTQFSMHEKKRLIALLWYQLDVSWDSIFKFTWALVNRVTEKRFGKTMVYRCLTSDSNSIVCKCKRGNP